jgi:hypothetical protein
MPRSTDTLFCHVRLSLSCRKALEGKREEGEGKVNLKEERERERRVEKGEISTPPEIWMLSFGHSDGFSICRDDTRTNQIIDCEAILALETT